MIYDAIYIIYDKIYDILHRLYYMTLLNEPFIYVAELFLVYLRQTKFSNINDTFRQVIGISVN